MSTLAGSIEFNTLCETWEKILKFKTPNQKFEELKKFFQNCVQVGNKIKNENKNANVSLYPILRLLLPQFERDRGPHGLKEKSLSLLYTRIFSLGKDALNLRKQLKRRSIYVGEDFADRVYNVVRNQLQSGKSSLSIEEVNEFLDSIAQNNASNEKKDTTFLTMAKKLSGFELKWLTRIVLKDLKLGIGKKKILEAFHPNAEDLFIVTSNLREVCERLNVYSKKSKAEIQIFSHFKPMLLERYKIEDVGKLFTDSSQQYFVQIKYDGERSQIHFKYGKFKFFTRMGFDITKNTLYGESSDSGGYLATQISRLLNKDCHSVILDGEMMGWHKEKGKFGSKGMTYDVKKLTERSSYQPCFIAYDLIMHNDELLVDLPYSERLQKLDKVFTAEEGLMMLGKTSRVSNSEQILEFFNKSLDEKEEGIVLKRCDALYKPNAREGTGCYKIKAEFSDNLIQDMDLIILGAYYGSGRSARYLKAFLMGVADSSAKEDDKPAKFQSVVSVSSGLSYEQLNELQKRFQLHWQSKCPENIIGPKTSPPDVWIKPKDSVILQLRATEIIRSSVYPLGYSLRFPRVLAVREDKPWYNACTSREFLSFIKDPGFVQKLTKRHATSSDLESAPSKKLPRQSISFQQKIDERFLGRRCFGITRLTRLLDEKEFCVINGDDELSKNEIEELLLKHSAKVVQNPRKETFCVIVGNPRVLKAKHVIQSGLFDVATISWLKRVTLAKNWSKLQDWYPWELLSARLSTKRRVAETYDEYYDSFTDDADQASLKRSLEKAEEAIVDKNLSNDDYKDLDKEFFENSKSPFSVFRGIAGYFHDPEDVEKFTFRFMSGTSHTEVDEYVTHIFVEKSSSNIIEQYKDIVTSRQSQIQIINNKWIVDCFKKRKLLKVNDYLINVNDFL